MKRRTLPEFLAITKAPVIYSNLLCATPTHLTRKLIDEEACDPLVIYIAYLVSNSALPNLCCPKYQ